MSENEPEKPRQGWGCLQWGVVVGAVGLLASYFIPAYGLTTQRAQQMKGGSNARQIVSLLMTYASEHNGLYPDQVKNLPRPTANAVFREAFLYFAQEGLELDETMFGCPFSMVEPDGNIGSAPDYEQVLMPRENHWMFTAGLTNTSLGNYPLLMEDAVHAGLPPQWLPYSKPASRFYDPRRLPGTAWPGGDSHVPE